ncbi:bile acid:Na+ symporter, BASS family [Butyrivibrio proteoclasticus]|uniref:Bile acid:Na+ symporter, BASS family n=1 Tax=Butyrivibrio proteoclasticus TaxID=43305 RepID=A0A1I5T991_9FIRM|nr:bile acid:sodium symporter family protein [Butyrivibrio proteoclasticus]SFP79381.1 bile acid:Na+ symporter, BASS family [Butyrivibrio proteoclasticus]
MKKVSSFVGKYMAIIVLVVAALALFVPGTCLWIQTSWVNYLLMVVMFGMGLTLKPEDFILVFKKPQDILLGCVAQFTIMPLIAFALGKAFGLEAGLLAGVILVGTCPGGTSSNVITYLSKGDVALSVGMTSVNTLLAPILTPAITYLLLRTSVTVDVLGMFVSIIKVVIVPIALGFVINRFFGKFTAKAGDVLPLISVTAITLIVAAVVSHNSARILETGAVVFVVVILHNLLGYACGYLLGKVLKLPVSKKKALSIEIGMQNSGLATSLAGTAFPDLAMATVPGAIFSVWHNISGAILANIYQKLVDDAEKNDVKEEPILEKAQ